jgi:hypothetical protein
MTVITIVVIVGEIMMIEDVMLEGAILEGKETTQGAEAETGAITIVVGTTAVIVTITGIATGTTGLEVVVMCVDLAWIAVIDSRAAVLASTPIPVNEKRIFY